MAELVLTVRAVIFHPWQTWIFLGILAGALAAAFGCGYLVGAY